MASTLAEQVAAKFKIAPKTETAPVAESSSAFNLDDSIKRNAALHGIPENLARAMIVQESGGKQSAVSNKGATGITQLMPDTAKYLGVDIADPEQNVEGGLRYLKEQYDTFGNWEHALAAYNAGPGAVKKYGGIPPFKETQNYVPSIMKRAGQISSAPAAAGEPAVEAPKLSAAAAAVANKFSVGAPAEAAPEQPIPATTEAVPQPQQVQASVGGNGIAEPVLSGSKGFLDTLGVSKLLGKAAEVPALQAASDAVRFWDDKSFMDRAQADQATTQAAIESSPISNVAGKTAGVVGQAVALNPVFKALGLAAGGAKAGTALKTLGTISEGAASSAIQEASTQDDVTADDLMKAAGTGAASAGVMKGATALLGAGANLGMKFAQGLKRNSKATEYITKDLGLSMTQGGLATKNAEKMQQFGEELQNTLKAADKAGKRIKLGEDILPDDVLQIATRKAQAGLRKEGDELLELANKMEKGKGTLAPSDANKLKRLFWEESRFKVDGDPSSAERAQAAYQRGVYLKNALESATADLPIGQQVRTLNQKLQQGIDLRNAIDASGRSKVLSPSNVVRAGLLGTGATAAMTGNVPLAAATLLGTTAGSQAAGKTAQALNATNIPTDIAAILTGKTFSTDKKKRKQ
jgi:hypothetical protein